MTIDSNSETREMPRLFSEPEAAEMLGVCRDTLGRLRRAGRIGHVRVGGAVRYSDELLFRFMDAHTRAAADEQSRAA